MTDRVTDKRSIGLVPNYSQTQSGKEKNHNGISFEKVLGDKVSGLEHQIKLSQHVKQRFKERQINFDADLAEKINTAFQKAEAKGSKDSLLLIDDLALIASIKNKTIVTALDEESIKEHIFTNIDSAVIIK